MSRHPTDVLLPAAFVDNRLVDRSVTIYCEGPHVFSGTLVVVEDPGQDNAAIRLRVDSAWFLRIPVCRVVAIGYPE